MNFLNMMYRFPDYPFSLLLRLLTYIHPAFRTGDFLQLRDREFYRAVVVSGCRVNGRKLL